MASDHFVAAEPDDPQAIETFAKVMAEQLEAADPATRLDIARKLAPCARTPLRHLAKFEAMDPELSDFVLERADGYSDRELKEAIARGVREATAVAGRKPLSPALANLITFHDDTGVVVALARNAFAELERAALIRLLRRARSLAEERGDLRLAEALLERRPVRAEYALLFLSARPDQRVEILLAAQRMQLGRPPGFPLSTSSTTLEELRGGGRRPAAGPVCRPSRRGARLRPPISPSESSTTCPASRLRSPSARLARPTRSWCGC